METAVGGAQAGFHLCRLVRTREDEARIARALGQRQEPLVWLRGDSDLLDALDGESIGEAVDPTEDAGRRHRDHHHTCRPHLARPPDDVLADGEAHEQLLERAGDAIRRQEPQHPRAKAANRPGRRLQHEDAPVVDPTLGVDRAVPQANSPHRPFRRIHDGLLNVARGPGWRDVNRLLEEGAHERVGLVEKRQHSQAPVVHQSLDGELGPGQVSLDLHRVRRRVAQRAHLPVTEQAPHPLERLDERGWIVRPHDAAAGRQRQRLQHARKADGGGQRHRVLVDSGRPIPGYRQAGGGETLAHEPFVSGGVCTIGRMERQAEGLGRGGGKHRWPVAERQHAGHRPGACGLDDGGHGGGLVVKPHRNGAVAPRVVETAAAVAGEGRLEAGAHGGLPEGTNLVPRLAGDDQKTTGQELLGLEAHGLGLRVT